MLVADDVDVGVCALHICMKLLNFYFTELSHTKNVIYLT